MLTYTLDEPAGFTRFPLRIMNSSNFCEIHKNSIALFRCSKCSRSVCSRCSIDGSSFCPKCRGTNILKDEKKHSQNEIRNILIGGFVMGLISLLVNILTDNFQLISKKDLISNSIIFFAFGISIASSIYFIKKTDVFDEIKKIPLIGITVLKYIIVGTSMVGIPIVYFLYLVYKYFKKEE